MGREKSAVASLAAGGKTIVSDTENADRPDRKSHGRRRRRAGAARAAA
jgi:hypothetical protein